MNEPGFSSRILRRFVETAAQELGTDQFTGMLALSKLPAEWTKPASFHKLNRLEAAKRYAALQAAMRTYYGRGARGALLRVGESLWHQLLSDSALVSKAQAAVIRRLPLSTRRKRTLELLSRFLSIKADDITIHTLDLDLLFVDHVSPTTHGFQSRSPICYVTQGLIRESLFWATSQRHDVEETSCKAHGDSTCEFQITTNK